MATIKPLSSSHMLPFNGSELSRRSLPSISWRLHRRIERDVRQALGGELHRISLKSLSRSICGDISVLGKDPVQVEVVVLSLESTRVEIELVLPLKGGNAEAKIAVFERLIGDLELKRISLSRNGLLGTTISLREVPVEVTFEANGSPAKVVMMTQAEALEVASGVRS